MVVEVHRHHHTSIKRSIYHAPFKDSCSHPVLRWLLDNGSTGLLLLIEFKMFAFGYCLQVCVGSCSPTSASRRSPVCACTSRSASPFPLPMRSSSAWTSRCTSPDVFSSSLWLATSSWRASTSRRRDSRRNPSLLCEEIPISDVWPSYDVIIRLRSPLAESDADTDDDVEIAKGLACCE